MSRYDLPFEKPIAELEKKLNELRVFSQKQDIDISKDIERMREKIAETRRNVYANLTPWQKVMVARHPMRPYPKDYVNKIADLFIELHGDRLYADDRAIIGGFTKIEDLRVMVIFTQKGRDTKSNLECNFGCAFPEGYRKALRLMKLAAKFDTPIVSLIDTPGAFPGVQSEERHIAEAIAVNLRDASVLPVPIVAVVTGEGGSGGALGIGVCDRLLILEYAYYSVISPEGCAAILWKDKAFADQAAKALKITSTDLLRMEIANEVIPEPNGGAHADPDGIADTLKKAIIKHIKELSAMPKEELIKKRYDKLREIGNYEEKLQEL
jgi:acetyl-CoA carboxylase carboxyl transferase subunit alpha